MYLPYDRLQNMEDLLEHNSDLSAKLMQIGDSIVYKLVQWTKRLPFYLELPVEVSHSLLVLLYDWCETRILVMNFTHFIATYNSHYKSVTLYLGSIN